MVTANRLLGALRPADLAILGKDFETVDLKLKAILHDPGDPTPFVEDRLRLEDAACECYGRVGPVRGARGAHQDVGLMETPLACR